MNRVLTGLIVGSLWLISQEVAVAQIMSFEAEALFWDREKDRNGTDLFNGPIDRLDTASDLSFSHEFGYRVRVGWENDCWGAEGIFSRIDNWHARTEGILTGLDFDTDGAGTNTLNFVNGITGAAVVAEEDAALPLLTDEGLLPGATYEMTNSTELDDVQVNLLRRHAVLRFVKAGIGIRHMRLVDTAGLGISGTFSDEQLGVNTIGELTHAALTGNIVGIPGTRTGVGGGLTHLGGAANGFINDVANGITSDLELSFLTDVTNNMTGVQYIADMMLFEGKCLSIEGILRAGAYHNRITSVLTEFYEEANLDRSVYGRSFVDKDDEVAFAGNVGLKIGYKVQENVRLFFGYEVFFLSGVALAADQWQEVRLDNFGTYTYELTTSTFTAHGGTGGVELLW